MSNAQEALKLALKALELNCSSQTESPATKAMAAIREALAHAPEVREQPASKPLTDEEIMRMARKSGLDLEPPKKMSWIEVQGRHEHLLILARAIEAKLREKNA